MDMKINYQKLKYETQTNINKYHIVLLQAEHWKILLKMLFQGENIGFIKIQTAYF